MLCKAIFGNSLDISYGYRLYYK